MTHDRPFRLHLCPTTHPRLVLLPVLLVTSGVLLSLGCGSDTTGPATLSPNQLYLTLQLSQHAINLALHDTMRLTATTLSAAGTPLPVGVVRFRSSDSSVTVDSTGLVTANFTTPQTTLSATGTTNGVTQVDTAIVQVTATGPDAPLAGFTLQLPPGEDTNVAVNANQAEYQQYGFPVFTAQATDAQGHPLTLSGVPLTLLVHYSTSDPLTGSLSTDNNVQYWNGQTYTGDVGFQTWKEGKESIGVETWAYGVAKHDIRTFVVGPPQRYVIRMVPVTPKASRTPIGTFFPSTYTVGIGAVVTWFNASLTTPIDVVFDDSSAVQPAITMVPGLGILVCGLVGIPCPTTGGGNISPFIEDTSAATAATLDGFGVSFSSLRSRSFPTAGTYTYHSRLYGTTGTLIVR